MRFLIRMMLLITAGGLTAVCLTLVFARQAPGPSLVAFTTINDHSDIVITLPGDHVRQWIITGEDDRLFPQWAPTCTMDRFNCRLAYFGAERSYLSSRSSLYVKALDHSPPQLIAQISPQRSAPSWSPDGNWIAFDVPEDASTEIYAAQVDGAEHRNISEHPAYDFVPRWSPDGQMIAFISYRDRPPIDNSDVYVATLDNNRHVVGLQQITSNSATDTLMEWSPDSQWLVYTSDWPPDVEPEIWIARPDSSEKRQLTDHPAVDTAPTWSPDGQWIAFVSQRGGNSDIYVIRPDGTDLTNLSRSTARDHRPAWSPDSRWLAFESDRNGQLDVFLVHPDGSDLRNLTTHPAADFGPVWSRDGRWIAFESLRSGNRDVWAVHPDGTELTNVSRRAGVDTSPTWSPPVEFPFSPGVAGTAVAILLFTVLSIRRGGT